MDSLVNEFLVQAISPFNEGMVIIGCTNIPWVIDDAARRRFTKCIYIPLPNGDERLKIFEFHVGADTTKDILPDQIDEFKNRTTGYGSHCLYLYYKYKYYFQQIITVQL